MNIFSYSKADICFNAPMHVGKVENVGSVNVHLFD